MRKRKACSPTPMSRSAERLLRPTSSSPRARISAWRRHTARAGNCSFLRDCRPTISTIFAMPRRCSSGLVTLSSDKSTLDYTAAGWLNLLECYLLLGDYEALESRGQDASSFLRWFPDFRLLAAYLRLMGRVIANPQETVNELKEEPAYREIESVADEATANNFGWSNSRVDDYLAKKVSDPKKTMFIAEVTRRVLREPKSLK